MPPDHIREAGFALLYRVQPERHQGPLVPHGWDFAARQVAETLLLVGRGLSYRKTGQRIRLNARRFRTDIEGLPVPSQAGRHRPPLHRRIRPGRARRG
jgi:hypothetical protein